jgi:hypothetical protein
MNKMKTLRVLVACEFSGVVRDAFRALGHDAMSCDLLPSDTPGQHYQGDVRDLMQPGRFDLMIAHPPCTYLCRSGYHWCNRPDSGPGVLPLKGQPRREAMIEAVELFRVLLSAPIPHIAVENPRPIVYAGLPKHDCTVQPWQFGHGETKETCLWLVNLPALMPSNIVEGREHRIHKAARTKDRWRIRSMTYAGIANAMAAQWSDYLIKNPA